MTTRKHGNAIQDKTAQDNIIQSTTIKTRQDVTKQTKTIHGNAIQQRTQDNTRHDNTISAQDNTMPNTRQYTTSQ